MKKDTTNGGWLKKHGKQVAVHSLILGVFLLYCVFLAAPLRDRLESIPNEAELYNIPLPAATNNILFDVNHFIVTSQSLEINGWAFIKNEDCQGSEAFIVLRSVDNTYIFDSAKQRRPDVTIHFKKQFDLDLDWSGFWSIIPLRMIESGDYKVGIYIKKGDIEALQYTNKSITK